MGAEPGRRRGTAAYLAKFRLGVSTQMSVVFQTAYIIPEDIKIV
jgi:hypothetical protein